MEVDQLTAKNLVLEAKVEALAAELKQSIHKLQVQNKSLKRQCQAANKIVEVHGGAAKEAAENRDALRSC